MKPPYGCARTHVRLQLVSLRGDSYNARWESEGGVLERQSWLASVKTVIDGLDLIDPSVLPDGFVNDCFQPVKQHKEILGDVKRQDLVNQFVQDLAAVGARALEKQGDKTYYFWAKLAELLQAFAGAEQVWFYRLGRNNQMFKIHPLTVEDETADPSKPLDLEDNPGTVQWKGFPQAVLLQVGSLIEDPLVLLFLHGKPFPRIAMDRVQALTAFDKVIFTLAKPHFPSLAPMEQLEISGPMETDDGIIGRDPAFLEALASVENAAKSDATVYLKGESGTGKEVFAKRLHALSERASGPFVPINCSAIPRELIESEMFGHEKGAFTGAYYRKIGKAEQAAGGTLFLDEIGEMPLSFQAKLLRYLQEKKFTRVGGNNPVHSDARIIVATHRDLREMVAEGTFREDLYYRVHVIPIQIPALRDRGRDIRLLAEVFFHKYISKSRASRRQVDESIFDVLESYHFPGNVRELDNIIQRTVVMTQKPRIGSDDLPEEVFRHDDDDDTRYSLHPFEKFDGILPTDRDALRDLKKEVEQVAFTYQRELDRRFLLHLLQQNGGSARKASEAAGINRTLFYKLLKRAGLDIGILNRGDA